MRKLIELLDDRKELHIVKGKMINIQALETNDDRKARYYVFDIKVVRKFGDNEYDTGFNMFHCVMNVDISKQFSIDDMKNLKNNEVIALLDISSKIVTKNNAKYNSIRIYCVDLDKLTDLNTLTTAI